MPTSGGSRISQANSEDGPSRARNDRDIPPADDAGSQRPHTASTSHASGTPARERDLRARGRNTMGRLLSAAIEVFDQRGYHATRVDDIVKVANTSHGTFYLYFTNKEDIFRALISDATSEMSRLAESLGPLSPEPSGREELRSWLGDLATSYQQFAPVIRAWTEAATSDARMRSSGEDITRAFVKMFERQLRRGTPTDLDPRTASIALVAMIERSFYYTLRNREDPINASVLNTLATICHRGLYPGS
ncbi:MAG: TetR/AcrR family transcriptional regulator [Acidimicrobiales bacterium]